MLTKNHNEQVKHATDIHTELMDLVYKMYMTEEVDFHRVITLLRESYGNQLTLLNKLKEIGGAECIESTNPTSGDNN